MRFYFFDGTADGFYSAVFLSYNRKNSLPTCNSEQLNLTDEALSVTTDEAHAERVKKKLCLYDSGAEREIKIILKSNLPNRAQIAYSYLRAILAAKMPVRGMLSDPSVLSATDAVKKVRREIDRLRGFLRFTECESGILYAACAPDNDVVEYLLPHFARRFPHEKFVIHDVKRKKAILYAAGDFVSVPLQKTDVFLSSREEEFSRLWKEYYRAVNIPGRENRKAQDNYMPRRYRKYMPETY